MIKFKHDDVIDTELYESYLKHDGYIAIDKERMSKTEQYERSHASTLAQLALDVMYHKSGASLRSLSTDAIYKYLTLYESCPEHYFNQRGVKGISIDTNKVLKKLLANGYATEFLEPYIQYRSLKSSCDKVAKTCSASLQLLGNNEDGCNVYALPYSVNESVNLRYYYKQFDIVAIPKMYNDCITVEDGYVLAWGDFAQSDFRIAYNLFMRSEENDKIMLSVEDKYEGMARIVAMAEGVTFDADAFKKDRPLYKQLTLATVYGTRHSVIPEENTFIQRLAAFLEKCPKYVEFYKRLHDRVALGLPLIIDSYFGTQAPLPIQARTEDTVNAALNKPIQTGTSEIIILTVNKILDIFYSLGYTREDICVYYTRHDEPIFKIRKEVLKNAWVFEQVSTILVDSWIPLKLDFGFGTRYKVVDEAITNYVEQVKQENQDKIDIFEIGREIDTEYYPVQAVCTLSAAYISIPQVNKSILTLYSREEHAAAYFLVDTLDKQELVVYLLKKMEEIMPKINVTNKSGVIVNNTFYDGEDFVENNYVRYHLENSNATVLPSVLCTYMAIRYCNKNNIEHSFTPPAKSYEDIINRVGELSYVI